MISKGLPQAFDHEPGCLVWNAGTPLARIHRNDRAALEFKPAGVGTPGRFDPCYDPPGAGISTLYAGEGALCSLGETVFRIQDSGSYQETLRVEKLKDQLLSEVVARRPLNLVALCGPHLHAYDYEPSDLQGGPSTYPWTRALAAVLHKAVPHADGLVWMSRQCNTEKAVVLWGDRVSIADLALTSRTSCPLTEEPAFAEVAKFAVMARVQLN